MSSEPLGLVIVVGITFLSSVIYIVSGAYRREDQNEIGDRGDFLLGPFVRNWLYWFLGPVERLAVGLKIAPFAFNLTGVALGVSAGFCFGNGNLNPGGWLLLLSGAVDVLDGRIARGQGLESPRGAFLDSTLDRFAEVSAFVGLAVFYRDSAALTIVVALAIGGSLLVSYTRASLRYAIEESFDRKRLTDTNTPMKRRRITFSKCLALYFLTQSNKGS